MRLTVIRVRCRTSLIRRSATTVSQRQAIRTTVIAVRRRLLPHVLTVNINTVGALVRACRISVRKAPARELAAFAKRIRPVTPVITLDSLVRLVRPVRRVAVVRLVRRERLVIRPAVAVVAVVVVPGVMVARVVLVALAEQGAMLVRMHVRPTLIR